MRTWLSVFTVCDLSGVVKLTNLIAGRCLPFTVAFVICALLLVAASATDPVTNFTFDGPTFVDAMLQSTLGWAYPPSLQTCMTNLKTSAESYAAETNRRLVTLFLKVGA